MVGIDVNRCLTMAALSAFFVLRQYLASHPGSSSSDAVAVIQRTNSDAAGLDYVGGSALLDVIQIELSDKGRRFDLRFVISRLIQLAQPWWLRLVPYGREQVKAVLNQNQIQCLREASLFDAVPSSEVVAWWDDLSASMRGVIDAERMLQAREAERRSLQYERDRLQSLGLTLEPQWVSLEDNTLGYDIKSYDVRDDKVVGRLIEVKSTAADSIFITRNEWRNAASAASNYCFHVWKIPGDRVLVYPVEAVRPCIPIDQGAGEWQNVRVTLGALEQAQAL